MKWVKEPMSPIYRLIDGDRQYAYIKWFGYSWYGSTYLTRIGPHQSLAQLKQFIDQRFRPTYSDIIH